MAHFVLYARRSAVCKADIERIAKTTGVTVLDKELGGALLVDTTGDVAEQLREQFPGWIIAEEVQYPPPGRQPYSVKEEDS